MSADTSTPSDHGGDALLREGIAAARSGKREQARELLTQVVNQDEANPMAWLWLSGVVDTLDDRELCLQNVLALDPTSEAARRGLVALHEERTAAPLVEATAGGAAAAAAGVRVYFGLTGGVAPEVVGGILEWAPRPLFFVVLLIFLFSLVVLVGLGLRWMPMYYVFFVYAVLLAVVLVASMINVAGIQAFGSVGMAMCVALLLATFQMRDDFVVEKRRVLLRPDQDVEGGHGLLVRGREYVRRKMWARAVIHLRPAVSLMPDDIDAHMTLAAAFIGLQRNDLVSKVLADARCIKPDDPRIEELVSWLNAQRPSGSFA